MFDANITVSNSGRGSIERFEAIENTMGVNKIAVALFEITALNKVIERYRIAINILGENSPNQSTNEFAINSLAPVLFIAVPKGITPARRKKTFQS